MRRILQAIITGSLLCSGAAQAGNFSFDFNTDPSSSGLFSVVSSTPNAGYWYPTDGVGVATNANDGFLLLTGGASQVVRIIFSDFDAGSVVNGFTFEADLRIGNGTEAPADGFSVNYCRSDDPVILDNANGAFAQGQNCEANLPEEGTQTGIGIGFDAWNSGGTAGSLCDVANQDIGPDVRAVTVRVDGILVLQYPCPTANGACTDATSVQTGPYSGDGSWTALCWAHLKVQMTTDAKLNVWWKGTQILNNYQTSYYPSAGRLVFAGRCGGSWEHQHVDNITIATTAAALAQIGNATGLPDGFSELVTDSGASVINTATANATATLDGVAVTPLTLTKAGTVTTVAYHGFPTLLVPGTTHTNVLTLKDSNGNTISAERTFTVPTFGTVAAADAVTGVDTTKPGFRLMPWQSGAQPNAIYWTEEQLIGLHGANNANLTAATDGGYIDYTGVINFNLDPAGGQAGSFQSGAGYTDSPMPGIPGANTLTGSTALEALMFMKFPAAGLYTLIVNSDDGFLVTEGKNPKDRFATRLGIYNGGKGASDVSFPVAVMAAGIYPIRLIWENGNGEFPGNGANLEFIVVKDGVKYLVNDSDATNTTGVVAYYSGPALPAYVSHLYPYNGASGARADKLVAQITDGSTTLASGSAHLYVDGTEIPVTATKSGSTTTVSANLTPANLMLPGSRTAALAWSDSNGTHSNTWTFSVSTYNTLNAGLSVPLSAADPSAPGLILQVAQVDPDIPRGVDDGMANQVDSANALLAGLYFPWYATNMVDLSGSSGLSPAFGNTYYWSNAVDFDIVTSGGDFAFNYALPGIPGLSGKSDNLAASFKGYVAFTNAGYYRMAVSSDDGFRVSQGTGPTRQVFHVTGSGVDRDVAAVVCSTNNSSFGGSLPLTPISGPIVYFPAGDPVMCKSATNLTGKIAVMNNSDFADRAYPDWAYTNGAIAAVVINDQQWGMPYLMGGSSPNRPIHIPTVCVSGYAGEEQMYATNANLVGTIGADAQLQLGIADYGKGMGWISFDFVVPTPGLYPLYMVYEQGGGGAGLEWASVAPTSLAWDDVTRSLVNDGTAAGALRSYRTVTVQPAPVLQIVKEGGVWKIYYTGTLKSSATVGGTYDAVPGATSPYTVPTGAAPMMFYRSSN
jgi:hypothetical protein